MARGKVASDTELWGGTVNNRTQLDEDAQA
jgi:hypothetical protein